jgi:glycosyltransferase involved in cell wall biosynthesis
VSGPRGAAFRPIAAFYLLASGDPACIPGGARSTLTILRHLRRFEPFAIVTRRDAVSDRLGELGVAHEVLPVRDRLLGFRAAPLHLKLARGLGLMADNLRLARILRRLRPGVFVCDEMASPACGLGSRLAGVPFLVYVRNSLRGDRLRSLYRLPMLAASRVVAVSPHLADLVRSGLGARHRGKVAQIYNSVDDVPGPADSSARASAKARLGLPPDKIAIGLTAFVEPRKRQLEFLEQVLPVLDERAFVALVGGEKDREYSRRCLEILGRAPEDRARFFGYCPQLAEWYAALDIVCLPAAAEGVPRTLIEAALMGLPGVAFRIPGAIDAIRDGETGFLAETFSELADRLNRLVADAPLRDSLGRAARDLALLRFDPETNTQALEAVLAEVASSRPRPGASGGLASVSGNQA